MAFVALLFAPAVATAVATAAGRQVATFDFGWRHRLGLHAEGPPTVNPWPLPNNTSPGNSPPEAAPTYADGTWDQVVLPHDGLVATGPSNISCPSGCSGRSYIPRSVMWYRKTFQLPPSWAEELADDRGLDTTSIWLEFDGVFRATSIYLNGELLAQNAQGYLGFQVPLTSGRARSLLRATESNVLALFVDPDTGAGFSPSRRSGWWYEGGGIYRHTRIVRAPTLNFDLNGVVARSAISWAGTPGATPRAASATLTLEATVRNQGTSASSAGTQVTFRVTDPMGEPVGTPASAPLPPVAPGATATVEQSVTLQDPALWSLRSPALYTVSAELVAAGTPVDGVNVTHGVREISFSGADPGPSCSVNHQPFKWRGFCDHDNFAVVGMAVPDRLKLFRAQMSRAVGGNSRRTSHNPPDPVMLDLYDALGMLVMDETRIFNSDNTSVAAMAGLVQRDRNHPSVAMWSFCNEVACEPPSSDPGSAEPQAGAALFQAAAIAADPTRPTSANTPGWGGHWPPFIPDDKLTDQIQIQGFSHAGGGPKGSPAQFHAQHPTKPIFGSECCSCNTNRDTDSGCESSDGHDTCVQQSFAADCSQAQTDVYNLPKWIVGTMVWTLFDYIGEPSGGWPNVIGSFGQFDVAGFPKAQAFWYKALWLLRIDDSSADKPFPTNGHDLAGGGGITADPENFPQSDNPAHTVHIVESWEAPVAYPPSPTPPKTKTIHVYSDATSVELFVNGVSQGTRTIPVQTPGGDGSPTTNQTWATWTNLTWVAGNVSAVARDDSAVVVASETRRTSGAAAGLVLSLDVPSPISGTGTHLLLDGQDTALVRASVVDATGQVVHDAAHPVTFSVSGPGVLQGVHNGMNWQHGRNDLATVEAFHGLVRAVVRATSVAGRPEAEQALLAAIDLDSDIVTNHSKPDNDLGSLTVTASTPGLPAVTLSIPVSTDPGSAGVKAVAAASAGKLVTF